MEAGAKNTFPNKGGGVHQGKSTLLKSLEPSTEPSSQHKISNLTLNTFSTFLNQFAHEAKMKNVNLTQVGHGLLEPPGIRKR